MGNINEFETKIPTQEIDKIRRYGEMFAYENLTINSYKREWPDELMELELKYFNEGYNSVLKMQQNISVEEKAKTL